MVIAKYSIASIDGYNWNNTLLDKLSIWRFCHTTCNKIDSLQSFDIGNEN